MGGETRRKNSGTDTSRSYGTLDDSSTSSKSESVHSSVVEKYSLHRFDDLPLWLKDNTFIHSGYRVHFSFWLCFKSIFHLHNETWCIWTHLLGFLAFVILMPVTMIVLFESPSTSYDYLIFAIFLIGAQFQMLFSTIFHTFNCHSPKTFQWLARLDYTGISCMIVGSYFPPLYYGFQCDTALKAIYLGIVSVLGIIGFSVSMVPFFQTPRFRTFRAVFFIVFGLYAVFPFPHLMIKFGFGEYLGFMWRELLMGATYITGACIYATRFPERIWPGKFDHGCGSHMIWHIFCIVAALLQWHTCLHIYYQFHRLPCLADV